MIELQKFIINHKNWEEELQAEPYCVKITRDGPYIMFKYNQIESDFSNPIVRECRGIILKEGTFEVVCHAFDKFGNYGESYVPEIDWETAVVQEKCDGSLIKIWYDDDDWHISTNGTIDAFKAFTDGGERSFGDLVIEAMPIPWNDFGNLASSSATYMFELCSKYNRVVVPHDEPKLYFLGWRDNSRDCELERSFSVFDDIFLTPKTYNLHSLDDTVAAAKELPWDEEGYVVCDKYFNRVKIKSPEYVKAHYARNNNTITTERLVDVILNGEQDEFLLYAEEWTNELMKVQTAMHLFAHSAREKLAEIFEMKNFENRGQYAAVVKNSPHMMQDFLFHCFNEQIFWDYAKKWSAADWVKAITPILETKGF